MSNKNTCGECKQENQTNGDIIRQKMFAQKELNCGSTTVRMCVCTDCANNRSWRGEYACNCREIEMQEGKCRQYIKQQASPQRRQN